MLHVVMGDVGEFAQRQRKTSMLGSVESCVESRSFHQGLDVDIVCHFVSLQRFSVS